MIDSWPFTFFLKNLKKIAKKLQKNCKKVAKKLQKSCKKVEKKLQKNCKNFAKCRKKNFLLCKIFAKFLQILNLHTDFRPREEFVRVSRHQSDEDCFLMNFWNNIIFHKCLVFDLIWTKKLFPTTPHSKSSSIAMYNWATYSRLGPLLTFWPFDQNVRKSNILIIRLIRCYCYIRSDSQNSHLLWGFIK